MGNIKIIPTKPWYKRWWGILLIVLCVFSAVGSLLPEPPKDEKANNNVPAPAPVQEKTVAEPEKAPALSFDPSKHYTYDACRKKCRYAQLFQTASNNYRPAWVD